MTTPTAAQAAAIARLASRFYNSQDISDANPGGFAADGHEVNFPAALEDVGAAAAYVGAAADQITSDTATATAARDTSTAARDEAVAARDAAEGYAAAVNLPAVGAADAGKTLMVRGDGTGYEVGSPVLYASAEGVLGQGDALSIPTPNVSVDRRFDRRLVQVLEEAVGTTATDQTLDMDFSGEAQWDYEATPGAVDLTLTQDADTTLYASGYSAARYIRGDSNARQHAGFWITSSIYMFVGGTHNGSNFDPYVVFSRPKYTTPAWPDDDSNAPYVDYRHRGTQSGIDGWTSVGCKLANGKGLMIAFNDGATAIRLALYEYAADNDDIVPSYERMLDVPYSIGYVNLKGAAPIDQDRALFINHRSGALEFYIADVSDAENGNAFVSLVGTLATPRSGFFHNTNLLARVGDGRYVVHGHYTDNATSNKYYSFALVRLNEDDTLSFSSWTDLVSGGSSYGWRDAAYVGHSPYGGYILVSFSYYNGSNWYYCVDRIQADWTGLAPIGITRLMNNINYQGWEVGPGLAGTDSQGRFVFPHKYHTSTSTVYLTLWRIEDDGSYTVDSQAFSNDFDVVYLMMPEPTNDFLCVYSRDMWSADYAQMRRLNAVGSSYYKIWRTVYGRLRYDAASSQPFAPADIGLSIYGGDGLARISSLKQLAAGGSAFSSAGAAANAFDGDAATSCDAGLNGHIGYDFGAQKTINALGLTSPSSAARNLVVEVSDDNFSTDVREVESFSVDLAANTMSWLTIGAPASGQYLRIRVTDNDSLSLSHVVLSDGSGAVSGKAFTQPAPGTLAAGEWDVSALRFAGGQVEAVAANQPLVTRDNTVDTSMWESITGGTFNGAGGCEATLFDGPQQSNNADWYVVPLTAASGVLVYENSGLYAVAFTLDVDGVPTLGSPLRMGNNTSYGPYSVAAVSDDTFVVLYLSSANSSYPHVQAATVSGTSITLGNPVQVASYSTERGSIFKLAEGKFGVVCATGPSTIAARAGTVSGQTITLGSSVNAYSTTPTSGYCTGARLDADKGIAIYPTSSGIRARVFTANGTTLSVSGEFVVSSDYTTGVSYPAAAALDTDKVLLTFSNSGIKALPFTVSGTTLGEAGAALAVIPNNSNHTHPMVLGANHVVVQYSDEKLRQLRVDGVAVTEELTGDVAFTAGTANGNCAGAAMAGYFWMLERNTSPANTTNLVRYELGASGLLAAPYFAISFDDRRTFRVWGGAAAVDIASDKNAVHGGTDGVWHYKAADGTWTPASQDALLTALKEGFGATPAHRTGKQVYSNMTSAEWQTLGWIKSATGKIDVALLLNRGDSADVLAFDYTSRSTWTPVSGADYRIDLELESEVRVTRTASGAASVKAVVQYQPGS